MNEYTDGQVRALATRIDHSYYALKRMNQLQKLISSLEFKKLKALRGKMIYEYQGFYAYQFLINLSELFRHLMSEPDLQLHLKSTNDQRIEFREKVRNVLAKSDTTDEYEETFMPYITNSGIPWDQELYGVIEFYKKLLKTKYQDTMIRYFELRIKEVDLFLGNNNFGLNFPEQDVR